MNESDNLSINESAETSESFSQKSQTDETTSISENSNDAVEKLEKDGSDMMAGVPTEYFWWDTVHDCHFDGRSDIPIYDEWLMMNTTKGYLEVGEPYIFPLGWKFINITFKGKVYSPGEKIYDEMFLYSSDREAIYKELRYNYEPLLFNVNINYKGLPKDIADTLPAFDTNPILSGSQYQIPEGPKVEGYVSEKYVMIPTAPYESQREIGSEIYVAGGTHANSITYVYKPEEKLEAQPVISHFIDIDGKLLGEETTCTGEIGEAYSTKAKVIPGYTLIRIDGDTDGKFTSTQQQVTYIYLKDDVNHFDGTYADYDGNMITTISDLDRELKIVKNVNVSFLNYKDNKLNLEIVGTTQRLNILGSIQSVTKRIQTQNGRIYYVIIVDNKQYVIHSDAFQAIPTASDLTQESDLAKYQNISLDFSGNYLNQINEVNRTVTLVNNYNVYDLLKTDGDVAIPPYTGTVSSLGMKDDVFTVTQEFVSSYGSKYYKILVDGYSYFINAAAFIIDSVKSFF